MNDIYREDVEVRKKNDKGTTSITDLTYKGSHIQHDFRFRLPSSIPPNPKHIIMALHIRRPEHVCQETRPTSSDLAHGMPILCQEHDRRVAAGEKQNLESRRPLSSEPTSLAVLAGVTLDESSTMSNGVEYQASAKKSG